MAVLEGAISGALVDVGSAPASGLHVIAKPDAYDVLGHYSYAAETGVMAAGIVALSDILQFRWTDATRLALIYEIAIQGVFQLTAFTAGAGSFRVSVARTFTAAGSGGGVATLTGNNQKHRTNMGSSLVGEIRIATTAALGAGTKTYDSAPHGLVSQMVLAAGNTQILGPTILYSRENAVHPIVLAQNEGFGIRATVPATGTWTVGLLVRWAEVATY